MGGLQGVLGRGGFLLYCFVVFLFYLFLSYLFIYLFIPLFFPPSVSLFTHSSPPNVYLILTPRLPSTNSVLSCITLITLHLPK